MISHFPDHRPTSAAEDRILRGRQGPSAGGGREAAAGLSSGPATGPATGPPSLRVGAGQGPPLTQLVLRVVRPRGRAPLIWRQVQPESLFRREILNWIFFLPCRYSRDGGGAAIPGGFCNDCNIPFRAGGEAYRHFTSKLHR